jgi:hypothetical protein
MRRQAKSLRAIGWAGLALGLVLLLSERVLAHCDTLDGPVVTEAKAALENGDVTPVLKWVAKDKEGEIREAFKKTLVVRTKGPEAQELADRYFFETLVRIHREGEGAPYTGLKPAGTPLEPGVEAADKALAGGNVDELVDEATKAVADGIRKRFADAAAKRAHADHTVEAGRAYVAAYVEFVHYVEGVFATAGGGGHAEGGCASESAHKEHEHRSEKHQEAGHVH